MRRVLALAAGITLAAVTPALAAPTATITGGPGFSVADVSGLPEHPTNATSGTVTFTFNGAGITTVECRNYKQGDPAPAYAPCDTVDATSGSHSVSGAPETEQLFELRITDSWPNTITRSYEWAIDQTAPTLTTANLGAITSTATINHFTLGASATPGLACSDNLAGIAACTDNSALSTGVLDSFERTFAATDRAGNPLAAPSKRSWRVDPPKYSDLVLADNPIGYWRLDDARGSLTAADASGNGRQGVYQGHVARDREGLLACHGSGHRPFACTGGNGYVAPAAGDSGRAAAFSGDNANHVRVQDVVAPTGPVSVEAWVRPSDASARNLFEDGATAQLYVSGGKFQFRHDANAAPVTGATAIVPGTLYHVVGVWDGTTETLYVNGAVDGTETPAPISVATAAQPTVYIGYGRNASAAFRGTMDEVALYDSALSAGKVAARYATGTVTEQQYTYAGAADTTPPSLIDIRVPHALEQFSVVMTPSKVPAFDYSCSDPDGPGGIACTGTQPDGTGMTLTPGAHSFGVTATNAAGLSFTHTHDYRVHAGFEDLLRCLPAITGCVPPVAYYRLNEAHSATQMVDVSGNGRHGEFRNDTKQGQTGISGDGDKTRQFLGEGGYAAVNGIAEPPLGYTMALWVNPVDTGAMTLMQHGSSGALFINAAGRYAFRPEERSPTVVGPPAAADNLFHQVAGVWDGVNATLYVDGATDPAWTVEAPAQPNGSDALMLGYGSVAPWLRGELDEVSYFDVALSAAKIYEHYLADPPAGDNAPARSRPAGGTTAAPGAETATAAKKASPKARVAKAKRALAKAKAKLRTLKRRGASRAAVRRAQKAVKTAKKRLAKARRAARA